MPYTTEKAITTVQTKADGSAGTLRMKQVNAEDWEGRRYFASTTLGTGVTGFTVDDPVAGMRLVWSSAEMKARELRYPTPVSGRKSCWKTPARAFEHQRQDAQLGITGTQCPPAEVDQPPYCKQSIPAARAEVDNTPAPAATLTDCNHINPGSQLEDLGTEVSHDHEAHGCRVTKAGTFGNVVRETWAIRVGSPRDNLLLPEKAVDDFPGSGSSTHTTSELTYLSMNDPVESLFQLPKEYGVETVEMEEIPCPDQPRPVSPR